MSEGVLKIWAWKACALAAISIALWSVSVPAQIHAATMQRQDRELENRLRAHIDVLASDEFEGRAPGTEGEAKTLRYLARQWFDIGLVSGTNDPGHEWFAPITVLSRTPEASNAYFLRKGYRTQIAPSDVLVLTSGRRSMVRNAPLLFLGQAQHFDFTRTELAGRIAVVLDSGAPDSTRQNALLAMGASAVITVLDGARDLSAVAELRKRSGFALSEDPVGGDLEAFIARSTMETLLKGTSHSLASLEAAALKEDFLPVVLDITGTLEATTSETKIRTHNLIGKLPGKREDTGAVLYVAHWDHFGKCSSAAGHDTICNGAVDNASGLAALTEVARRLSRGGQFDRDIYFLASTAEELGLLGAHGFAEAPPLPLNEIIAAFNIDSIAIAPAKTPFVIMGQGMTSLDQDIARVAKAEGFTLRDSPEAQAYVKRQDGWALLQHDIPAVMVTTAYGDLPRMRTFFETEYHAPGDDLTHPLELGGAVDDVKMLTALGKWFADTKKVPAIGPETAFLKKDSIPLK